MNIGEIKRYALTLTFASLIVCVSACDELVSILTRGEMSQTKSDMPQLEGLTEEISIGLIMPLTGTLDLTDLS